MSVLTMRKRKHDFEDSVCLDTNRYKPKRKNKTKCRVKGEID